MNRQNRHTNRLRGGFLTHWCGVPLCLLQAKKDMRQQKDVVDCDRELLEIMRMTDFIGLTELPEALRNITTGKLPTYWRLYRKATEEAFPVYRAAGRIFVRQEDLPLIAEVFGQKHRQNLARKSRKCLSCLTDFMSHGPGNRVCGRCKGLEAWSSSHPVEFSIAAF